MKLPGHGITRSASPSICPPHAAAAGLLLSAVPAGDIDRQRRPPGAQYRLANEKKILT